MPAEPRMVSSRRTRRRVWWAVAALTLPAAAFWVWSALPREYTLPPRLTLGTQGPPRRPLAFSSDGSALATTGRVAGIEFWELATRRLRPPTPLSPTSGDHNIVFSPDGRWRAAV